MYLTKEEVTKLRSRYPNSIPVIISKGKDFRLAWRCKTSDSDVKLLVPESMTVLQLKLEIHKTLKQLNGTTSDAIYLSCNDNIIPSNNTLMTYVLSMYGKGGALYMSLNGESAFG